MKIEEKRKKTHWPSLLILICLVLGAGSFLLGSIGFLVNSVFLFFDGGVDPVGSMISSTATAIEGVLLLWASWFVFQKTSGGNISDQDVVIRISELYLFMAIIVAATAFLVGSIVSIRDNQLISLLLLPGLTIFVILIPIKVIAYMAMRKIYLGSHWQTWAVFGLGMTLAPLLVIFIELIFAAIILTILALVIAAQPEFIYTFLQIAQNFNPQDGQEKLFELVASMLMKPGVIAGIILYLAVIVPLVEELFKPLGVWLFSNQISQPSQGFALGIVSGSAFAIVEGFGISGQGGSQWPVVVGLRAGTSLLHIATTGLMGYAIISAVKKKRIAALVGTYLTTVSIHGLWNAAAAGLGISVLSGYLAVDHILSGLLPASIGGLAILLTGQLIMLQRVNRSLAV